MGVLVMVEKDTITMAAADGSRLSVRKGTLSQPAAQAVTVIIPGRALN
jgi:DNA polymerase III sliding clamp (beta) subunit (PCNA family)